MRRRSRITVKVVSQFHWNLMLWLFLQREESIKFWWWSGPGYRFRFIFLFHQHCVGEYGIFKITGCFSRTSVKWLVPTMEWIHYVFGQIQQIPDLDRSKTSVFKYQITFGWGSQSSRGEEICLALTEVCTVRMPSSSSVISARQLRLVKDRAAQLF